MKKTLFLFTFLAVVFASYAYNFSAVAPTGQTLYYTITSSTSPRTVAVTYPSSSSSSPWSGYTMPTGDLTIPSTVSYEGTTYSVTSIGIKAFSECVDLTSVTIPNSVTDIGWCAFEYCVSMSVTIPNSVTHISFLAFNYVKNIVYLGNASGSPWGALTVNGYVEGDLIYENANKTKVTGCYTSATSVTIPNSVTSIGNYAFFYCYNLTSVTIPNSVTSIGDYAFYICSGLTSVTIPNSVTSIGSSAFYGCSGLTSVTIPNSVTSIGDYAFCRCVGLTSVTIPNSVISIGSDAFYLVRNIIYLGNASGSPWGALTVNGYVEGDLIYENANKTKVTGCNASATSVTIPNSVTSIGSFAFTDCSGLTSVTIGNSVTSIEDNAFSGCTNVDTLYYNARALTTNSYWLNSSYGFRPMENLRTIIIGDSVQTLPEGVFYNQSSLHTVYSLNPTAPTLGSFCFYNCLIQEIHIPCGSLGSYSSRWTSFRNYLQEPNAPFVRTLLSNNDTMGNVRLLSQVCADTSTILATPNYGYHFTQWSDGDTANPRTFILTQDTTFTAEFAINQYSIMAVSADAVMGIALGDSTVDYLQQATLTAIPNYGYHFVRWSDGSTDNPHTVTVTQNRTYTAQFTYNTYHITKNCDDTKGTIIGSSSANYLSTVTLTANPNYGYHFTQWSDSVTDNPRTFVLTQDTAFTAEFERNSYAITGVTGDASFGQVQGGGSFLYLDTIVLTATAVDHYHFTHWQDGNTENPRSIVVYSDSVFTAQFAIDTQHIVVVSSDINMGYVSGGGDIIYGQPVTVSATAYSGYHFSCWSNGSRYNPYTFAAIQDLTLSAVFVSDEAPFYTITVAANNAAMGHVEGSGTYDDGTVALITATPSEGCQFLHWSDGSTEAQHLVTISATATYTAYFAPESCSVTTETNDANAGVVSGDGIYYMGDTLSLTATANEGYSFTHWSDGSTDAVRTIVVDENLSAAMQSLGGGAYGITFTAYFENSTEGIEMVQKSYTLTVVGNAIRISGAMGETVRVFDVVGRQLLTKKLDSEEILLNQTGVFFVQVGNTPAEKVVIVR